MTTNSSTNSTIKRVALIQMSCVPDTQANLDKAADRVREAARAGANIICLPELFRAQYFCQREDHALFGHAESIPGPSTDALSRSRAARTRSSSSPASSSAAPPASTTTPPPSSTKPTADNIAGIYRKMHIPDDPLYYEKFYFTPGDLGFNATQTSAGPIGTLVCWDQWYPEGARLTALNGAETLFYPTAIGWHPSEKAEFGERPVRRLADHPARPRHRQRRLRLRRQPRRPRARRRLHHRHQRRPRHRDSTAPATTRPQPASSSGAAASSPTPSAASSPRPPTTKKKSSIADLDPKLKSKSPASTGPSSATAASTPTTASPAASSIRA